MNTKIKSLWGNFSELDNIQSPYIILKNQASKLTHLTNNLLVGNVEKFLFQDNRQYQNASVLKIEVPSLKNYSIEVVRIDYNFDLYPLLLKSKVIDIGLFGLSKSKECASENDLNKALEEVLSSNKVKRIIGTLLKEVEE